MRGLAQAGLNRSTDEWTRISGAFPASNDSRLSLENVRRQDGVIVIVAAAIGNAAACPGCGNHSCRVLGLKTAAALDLAERKT